MSRTKHSHKGPGWEFWSRRPLCGLPNSAENKRLVNHIERQQRRALVRKELAQLKETA